MKSESPWGKSRKSLAASHQRSWLWGRHAVEEALAAGRWPVLELLVDDRLPDTQFEPLRRMVASQGTTIQRVPASRIVQLCRAEDHQGLLARMGEFPCFSLRDLASRLKSPSGARVHAMPRSDRQHQDQHQDARDAAGSDGNQDGTSGPESRMIAASPKSLSPLYVMCDRIQDAHNFGAILRCCDAMRVDGVIIGERSQVRVTPHVARASSGAVNHLDIFQVPHLVEAADLLRQHGYTMLAASEKATGFLWQVNTLGPVGIVIGSEAVGIDSELLSACDQAISIPMLGRVDSLNAAVAAGIILYECRRQQWSI